MSIISEKFNSRVSQLKNEFSINKNIVHQGVKGGLNESEIADLITDVVPKRYKVTKGIIENSIGEQSNETDIFIYDDEILPAYIKHELTFVPIEAVRYIFEIKSLLNSQELKTTISKFSHFLTIGGHSPRVLFAFSSDIKGNELARYFSNEGKSFYTHPTIDVLCVSGKGYYFYTKDDYYLKDFFPLEELLSQLKEDGHFNIEEPKEALNELMRDNEILNNLSRAQFALLIKSTINCDEVTRNINDKNLILNEVEFNNIKFSIHKWHGIEDEENIVELGLLSGIANTLSKKSFGDYLLSGSNFQTKVFSICYEDMWGNISHKDFNEKGLNYDINQPKFDLISSEDSTEVKFYFN